MCVVDRRANRCSRAAVEAHTLREHLASSSSPAQDASLVLLDEAEIMRETGRRPLSRTQLCRHRAQYGRLCTSWSCVAALRMSRGDKLLVSSCTPPLVLSMLWHWLSLPAVRCGGIATVGVVPDPCRARALLSAALLVRLTPCRHALAALAALSRRRHMKRLCRDCGRAKAASGPARDRCERSVQVELRSLGLA